MLRIIVVFVVGMVFALGTASAQSEAEKKALAALKVPLNMASVDTAKPGRPVTGIYLYETHAFPDTAVAALKELPNLERIQFYSCTIPLGLMEKLNALPKLTSIRITHGKPKPEVYLELGKLEKLEDLYIWNDNYDDAALAGLKASKKLVSLEVKMSKGVTDKGVLALKDLPALAKLRIDCQTPGEVTVASLKQFKALKYLDLPTSKTPSQDLKELQALPKLEFLKIVDPLDDDAMKTLASFPALQVLRLHGEGVTDKNLALLKDLKTLNSIALYSKGIAGTGLKDLKSLTRIRLYTDGLTDAGIEAIAALPELKSLGFGGRMQTGLTPSGLPHLKNAAKIEELVFQGDSITDAALAELKGLKELRKLVLIFSKNVTDTGVKELAALPKLENLTIAACGETRTGIAALQKAKPKLKIDQSIITGIDFEY